MHKPAVQTADSRNPIDNVSPKIKIIALVDDAVVLIKGQLRAAIDGRTGPISKHHLHLPLEENFWPLLDYRGDFHIKLLAAIGQPLAKGFESIYSLNPLDAVLENDVFVVIGKNMRPVRLTLSIVGAGPKLTE